VRVLVTGGAGFVGSHVVDRLVSAGHDVRVLDTLLDAAHDAEPWYLDDTVDYRWGDVCDPDTARRACDGVDAVCHQAAMVGLGVDFDDAPAYALHNDLGTAVLLAALHSSKFRGRIVLASSMVVYGEGRYLCAAHGDVRPGPREPSRLRLGAWDPTCPACGSALRPASVPERAATDPRNVYAATKLHQEHLCSAFGREHGLPVTALRYHNVYGPRMPRDTPYAGVAAIFASAVAQLSAPRVFEDGGQLRDFVHVDDVARANVLALTTDRPVEGAVNVASGEPRSIFDLAAAITSADPAAPPPRVVGGSRAGDVRHVFAATDRARRELGFVAETPFESGVRELATTRLRA
jgi:dTDP-L-rhamnose 4-epimerase